LVRFTFFIAPKKEEHMSGSTGLFTSLEEIEALVSAFETCSIPPAEFSHRNHLAVCLHYLTSLGFAGAATAMRDGLTNFLERNQLHGYNETITLFWLKRLEREVAGGRSRANRLAVINRALIANLNSKLIFAYYSRECVMSDRAKGEWVEPDLKSMEA
jgi:hypothetical protein